MYEDVKEYFSNEEFQKEMREKGAYKKTCEKAHVTYSNLNPSRHTANTGYVFKYATNDKTANDFFQKQSNAVLKRTMGAFDVFLANVQMTAKDLGFTSYS